MQYKNIVLYGAGKCYQNLKGMLSALCEINYICDRKFTHEESVDGVETIHRSQVKDLEKCLVIICLYNQEEALKVKRSFESEGIECKLYNEILNLGQIQPMEYDELKEMMIDGKYIDEFNNRIEFAGEIPENIRVNFIGVDNYVYIGENVKAHRKLIVRCGTRARVIIGDNCTFHDVDLDASWESIEIGDDCMFSFGVFLRNTDVHHIF